MIFAIRPLFHIIIELSQIEQKYCFFLLELGSEVVKN